MSRQRIAVVFFGVFIMSVVSGCNRDQDKTTPVGQQPQGQSTAQDYPSTRNMEQPNPSVGGNNSATNKQAPASANQSPPAPGTGR